MYEKVSCLWLSVASERHYDRCHVDVASVTDWLPGAFSFPLSPTLFPVIYFSTFPRVPSCSFFSPSLISFINRPLFLPLAPTVFAAKRRTLHHDTAGRDVARHCCGDEVPVRHELRAPRPRRPEYPGQQQLGLQGL